MEKRYGSPKRQDGLYKVGRNKYDLFYGFGEDEQGGWNYYQRFTHQPSLAEVKEAIIGQINADTDRYILSGFVWQGMPVWLSAENQFNYKAAYDLAVQTDGASLPATFKFGTDDQPLYHTFDSLDSLADFYTAALAFVQSALAACWLEKDSIDWSAFSLT